MPYIEREQREYYDKQILELRKKLCDNQFNPGHVNYVITKLIHYALEYSGGKNYYAINKVVGILECAKLEIYRMVASPYENKKRREEGPISTLDSLSLEDVR